MNCEMKSTCGKYDYRNCLDFSGYRAGCFVAIDNVAETQGKKAVVDRKFKFLAVNPCNGHIYTEENALILCAKDAAVLAALNQYLLACIDLGANEEHIESIKMLFQRVQDFQEKNGSRVPDTVGQCELDRCLGGIMIPEG